MDSTIVTKVIIMILSSIILIKYIMKLCIMYFMKLSNIPSR